jgi:hypothetical protein
LLAIAFSLFFSSEKVQTRVANSITQRVNSSFETDIEIGAAKIALTGGVRLGAVLIKDHKKDTLFFLKELKLQLVELEGVLKGDYQLSSLSIDQPFLSIKTYAEESSSNLQQFIDKLKNSSKKSKTFLSSIQVLSMDNARLSLTDVDKDFAINIQDLNGLFSSLQFDAQSLSGEVEQLNYRSTQLEELQALKGKLSFDQDNLVIEDFDIKTPNTQIKGDLQINAPEISVPAIMDDGILSLKISEGKLLTTVFSSTSLQLPSGELRLSGEAKGPLSKLKLSLNAQTNQNSRFNGDLTIGYHNANGIAIEGKNVSIKIDPTDIEQYITALLPASSPLQELNLNELSAQGEFSFQENQSLTGSLTLILNQGKLNTVMAFEKLEKGWDFSQKLLLTAIGKGNLFKSAPQLESINGNAQISGLLKDNQLVTLDYNSHFDTIEWNKFPYHHLNLNLRKDLEELNLMVALEDERISLKGEMQQDLKTPDKNLLVKSNIAFIDLSAFGWAPPGDKVRLGTNLLVTGSRNSLNEIRVENTVIENIQAKSTFKDFSLFFSSVNGKNKVRQQGSDLFQFSLDGKFTYQNIPMLLEGAIREALLLPQKNNFETAEQFTFDLDLNKKTLQALYPAVETPNNIRLKGDISAKKGISNFLIDLPYIVFKGYTVEGLSLKTFSDKAKELTQFKAERLRGKNINISKVALITKDGDDNLKGYFKGQFGLDNVNQFSVDFTYNQILNKAFFKLDKAQVVLEGDQWGLTNGKNNSFIYDNAQKEFVIDNFALSTTNQSLEINGAYQSKTNFSIGLSTNQLSLANILPKGEKFNFKGILSSNFSIDQGKEQQLLQTDIKVDDLVINGTSMGDFSLEAGGSSQLKTYQLKTALTKAGNTSLSGTGNIFISETTPRIDIDLDLQSLDMSFLSALGKDKITDVVGSLSGKMNLWGAIDDLKLRGEGALDGWSMYIPSTNTRYAIADNTSLQFRDRLINFNESSLIETSANTFARLSGNISHINFKAWEMDLTLLTDRLLVYDRPENNNALFYGHGYLTGQAKFQGPTKSLTLEVIGSTSEGTTLVIPWQEDKGLSDTSFIDYIAKGKEAQEEVTTNISAIDEAFRGFEMIFDLDVNRNAEVEIVVDQSSGSTLSGRGSGNIFIETNIDGKFNIWGDFIAYEGVYNFKNLGLIDKKFAVEQGGTIVWEGDPLEAQLNIGATYQVPGGANPALLVDNPNFNRKIPTNVGIQLRGNLIKPDDPIFDISFPNTTGIVVSEINYRLADQERRQLQAISLLSQGIFISDVSVSFQGITNNLYEKASDVFSTLLGSNEGKLNVGLNYLQGEENPAFDLRTEDRIGLTLSTQISDRILINGKIGVPIDGVEQSVIVGDVQIDFILNESGSLKAKVFNRENDFRYLGDEFGYTQGMGMSYQVDFNTFQELLTKITSKATQSKEHDVIQYDFQAIDFINKKN